MSKLTKIESGTVANVRPETVEREGLEALQRERARLMKTIERAEHHLSEMTDKFDVLLREVDAGDWDRVPEARKHAKEMREWMRIALELEVKRESRRRSNEQGERAYALDLQRARSQIGCRMARLRATRCPGSVSE